jgi:hypothetical protein
MSLGMNPSKSMKPKFVCVEPRTSKAKNRFYNLMNELHSCRVEQETDDQMFLASITGKYHFWMNKTNDENWSVIK